MSIADKQAMNLDLSIICLVAIAIGVWVLVFAGMNAL
jgi:hypothetical protein